MPKHIELQGLSPSPEIHSRIFPRVSWAPRKGAFDFRQKLAARTTTLGLFTLQYRDLPGLAESGVLMPLDDLFPAKTRDHYLPQAVEMCRYRGQLYGIPEDISVFSLVARKDVLAAKGFEPPETWAELTAQAKRLSGLRGRRVITLDAGPFGALVFALTLLGANGLNPDTESPQTADELRAMRQAYEWIHALYYRHRVLDLGSYLDWRNRSPLEPSREMAEGSVIFNFMWTAGLSPWPKSLVDELLILPFPTGPLRTPGKLRLPASGRCWCIPRNTADPETARRALVAIQKPEVAADAELDGPFIYSCWRTLWRDRKIRRRFPAYRHAEGLFRNLVCFAPLTNGARFLRIDNAFRYALGDQADGRAFIGRFTGRSEGQAPKSLARHPSVREAIEYTKQNLKDIRGAAEMAGIIGMNKDYFGRLFKRETGLDYVAFLRDQRMERARQYLHETGLSIKEIAFRIGFHNPDYFSRTFHAYWGMSARTMRKQGADQDGDMSVTEDVK